MIERAPIGDILPPALVRDAVPEWEEWSRIVETAQRRRILYGEWGRDIVQRIRREVGDVRAELWGEPELSANVALSACSAVAQLYHQPPHITGSGAATLTRLLDAAGWAPMMQRVQRDTIGLREMHMRVTLDRDPLTDEDRLVLLPVPPDLVSVRLDPLRPTRPLEIRHYVWRDNRWTTDLYVVDGDRAEWRCVSSDGGEDLSPRYLMGPDGQPAPAGGFRGDAYPWRVAGRAVLPWVTYHAAITGHYYDWRTMREAFDGTLSIAVLWTYWRHILQTASWPQRYLINLDVAGAGADAERRYLEPDPTLILRLTQDMETAGTTATAGSFDTSANVHEVAEALMAYERRILAYAGLSPSEVMRSSGDPRSGYALAVTRDGQRESQRRFAPVFRMSDRELMALIAGLVGLSNRSFNIEYTLMPLSAAEQKGERDHVIDTVAAGLMSRAEAYQRLNPQLTPDEIATRLAAIDTERRANGPDDRDREPGADRRRDDDPDDDPDDPDGE